MNRKDLQRISKIAKELLLNDERFKGKFTVEVTDHDLIKEIYKRGGYKEKVVYNSMSVTVMSRLQIESKRENPLFEMEWTKTNRMCRKFILKK